jgi:hypothetical protein
MATFNSVINKLDCSAKDLYGSGTANCQFDLTNLSGGGVGFLKPGTAIPSELTQASLIALQASGKLIVLQGIFSVEDAGSDDQNETSESGVIRLATKGLMGYRINFVNGLMYQRALASLESFGRYETILWDSAGNVLLRLDSQGNGRGYTTGQIQVARPTLASGGTAAKQSLIIQWTKINEFNNNVAYLDADTLEAAEVSFLELDGVNQMKIELNAPSDGATELTGRFVNANDNNTTDTTITDGDFVFVGATVSALTINANGTFSATVTAVSTGDEISMSLDGIVVSDANVLYQSNTAKVVVVA